MEMLSERPGSRVLDWDSLKVQRTQVLGFLYPVLQGV